MHSMIFTFTHILGQICQRPNISSSTCSWESLLIFHTFTIQQCPIALKQIQLDIHLSLLVYLYYVCLIRLKSPW